MIFPSKLKEINFEEKILSLIYFYQGGINYNDLLDMNYKKIFDLIESTEKLQKRIDQNIKRQTRK